MRKKELIEENEELKAKVKYLMRDIQRLLDMLALYQRYTKLPKDN